MPSEYDYVNLSFVVCLSSPVWSIRVFVILYCKLVYPTQVNSAFRVL